MLAPSKIISFQVFNYADSAHVVMLSFICVISPGTCGFPSRTFIMNSQPSPLHMSTQLIKIAIFKNFNLVQSLYSLSIDSLYLDLNCSQN